MERLAGLGILAGPGHFYGPFHPRHVRLSLTATDERIAAAAARLDAPHGTPDSGFLQRNRRLLWPCQPKLRGPTRL